MKNFYQKILQNKWPMKLVPDPFVFIKDQAQHLLENKIFEIS